MSEHYRAALQTLRAQATPAEDAGAATRERILESLAYRAQRRRQRRKVALVLLAASFLVPTALAYYLSGRQQEGDAAPARARVAVPRTLPEQVPGASETPIEPAVPTRAATEPPKRRLRRTVSESSERAAPVAVAAAEAPARSIASSDARALYMTAHRLHFGGAPRAALSAWDAYLATQPEGPLAVEARYNRAVVLVRLGRHGDARAQLLPFARGEYGSFRRADAALLLRQLE
jgi:hypothetical protein